MKLTVKVIPNAARNMVVGWLDGRLKLKVSAQPEKGKANKAVIRLLAHVFQISTKNIELLSGSTHSIKVFELTGLNHEQVQQRVAELLG